MTLRRRLRGESVTDTSLLSPPSLAALLLAGNSSADTESSAGGEPDTEWTYLLTTDDQLNQSIRKEFYYDHVSECFCHVTFIEKCYGAICGSQLCVLLVLKLFFSNCAHQISFLFFVL